MTPFKVMTSLLNNTTPTEEEKGTMNSFFLVRWLSNNKHTLQMGNEINKNYSIPVSNQYKFCEDWIYLTRMKNKVKFIQFSKEKQNTEFQQLLSNIQRKYKVNEIHAQEYFEMMDTDQKNKMYNLYNEGFMK